MKRNTPSIRSQEITLQNTSWLNDSLESLKIPERPHTYVKSFCKQAEAFNFADSRNKCRIGKNPNEGVKVFSKELNAKGVRKYLAAGYREFYKMYMNMQAHERTHYEVIRELDRCQLFFDIEYMKDLNPGADGDKAMAAFKTCVAQFIREESPEIQAFDGMLEFVDLEATNEKKFSRHVIVRIPGHAFRSVYHVGHFVRRLKEKVAAKAETDSDLQCMFVSDGKGEEKVWFVDMGVYTKNRCFRILHSTKFKYRLAKGEDGLNPYTLRMKSKFGPLDKRKCENDFRAFKRTLVCYLDESQKRGAVIEYAGESVLPKRARARGGARAPPTGSSSKPSPYPKIDAYMQQFIQQWPEQAEWGNMYTPYRIPDDVPVDDELCKKVPGSIYKWTLENDDFLNEPLHIRYDVATNNYCQFIRRRHRRNHIFFEVHLRRRTVVQKCWDVDCRGKVSIALPLPLHLQTEAAKANQLKSEPKEPPLRRESQNEYVQECRKRKYSQASLENPTPAVRIVKVKREKMGFAFTSSLELHTDSLKSESEHSVNFQPPLPPQKRKVKHEPSPRPQKRMKSTPTPRKSKKMRKKPIFGRRRLQKSSATRGRKGTPLLKRRLAGNGARAKPAGNMFAKSPLQKSIEKQCNIFKNAPKIKTKKKRTLQANFNTTWTQQAHSSQESVCSQRGYKRLEQRGHRRKSSEDSGDGDAALSQEFGKRLSLSQEGIAHQQVSSSDLSTSMKDNTNTSTTMESVDVSELTSTNKQNDNETLHEQTGDLAIGTRGVHQQKQYRHKYASAKEVELSQEFPPPLTALDNANGFTSSVDPIFSTSVRTKRGTYIRRERQDSEQMSPVLKRKNRSRKRARK